MTAKYHKIKNLSCGFVSKKKSCQTFSVFFFFLNYLLLFFSGTTTDLLDRGEALMFYLASNKLLVLF